MNIRTTAERLETRARTGSLHRTLGRFRAARRAYSLYQNKRQQIAPTFHRERLSPRKSRYFEDVIPDDFVQALREEGVGFGLQLDPEAVQEIYQFACDKPCTEPGFKEIFWAREVENGQLNDRLALRGLVKTPEDCPVVQQLARDAKLLEIVRGYLQYWPTRISYHLTWSFATQIPTEVLKAHYPPLNYHYDVAGYNFMTSYFYITDVDAEAGAHEMVARSHNAKPLHTLFVAHSGRQSDRQVLNHFGEEHKIIIEGKPGFGFVQDPSCYHKLLPTRTRNRLLLQIRYA